MALVVVDTETTGLGQHDSHGPRPDAIVQVGIAWRHPSRGVQTWERNCNPGSEFLEGGRADVALGISGLTRDQVLAAPSCKRVAGELRVILAQIKRAQGVVQLRAFNVEFDKSFLAVEPWMLRNGWGPCLMVEAAEGFGFSTGRVGLAKAAATLGIRVDGRPHTAAVDAHTALLVHEHFARWRVTQGLREF